MKPVRIFDADFLNRLAAEAAAAPRRRKNYNLHAADDAACHRFFNALCANSYVAPHRHAEPAKDETLVLLRGRLGAVIFDESGAVRATHLLRPGMIADVPANTFHTWVALEDGTIFFEAKAGPYRPLTADEKAPFAPPEGDPRAAAYLATLQALFPAS